MHPRYDDITSRIPEPPSWWQEGGVPRYGTFTPEQSSSIYAREVALVEIACQSCGTRFRVVFTADQMDQFEGRDIAGQIRDCTMTYGDPPNTGCCAAGATMNSDPIAVIEYWSKCHQKYVEGTRITDWERYNEWLRDPLLEGPF
jgi:hypothetical protein